MGNLIVSIIIILLIGFSVKYILKSRKKGIKCIGCPYAKECSKNSCNSNF